MMSVVKGKGLLGATMGTVKRMLQTLEAVVEMQLDVTRTVYSIKR
jgi:hypothetical protein